MRIFFDCDGVLASFTSNVVRIANSIWPNKLPSDFMPKEWSYAEVFSEGDWSRIWEEIKLIPNFWLREQPIDENVRALETWLNPWSAGYGLNRRGDHEIFFITSRIPTGGVSSQAQTQLWLHQYGLYSKQKPPTVIAVEGSAAKKEVIERYDIAIGIDDLPSTVEELNTLSEHTCFLLDQPWNRESKQPRVKNLQEFLDIVDGGVYPLR